jgi:hypothetical protein
MFFSTKLTAFASLAGLMLASAPITRAAEIQVKVGGPGVLKFDPENIVGGDYLFYQAI